MADFYELDFLPVHTSKSGDAIAIRYQLGEHVLVHLVDGGYTSTAENVSAHIKKYYGTTHIHRVVVTHPDKDHAEGLAPILEEFTVSELWMLRPWAYAQLLLPHFSRYNSAENLAKRLQDDYPYIHELEKIAVRRNIKIREPWQGEDIGPFKVLAPSPARYFDLVIRSEKTPQPAADSAGIFAEAFQAFARAVKFVKSGWGSERFSDEDTSNENEMSVIQYAVLNGHKILLTGDAGRGGLTEAADYAPKVGLILPGIDKFQVPHHGGRRNVSTEILDRWLGPRLPQILPEGSETFTAMISSAKEDPEHPRKAVERAMRHRGAFVATTEEADFCVSINAPKRDWGSMKQRPYPDEQEE
jgi:beta-lactamase superfamily II metal-dependent hydrolase